MIQIQSILFKLNNQEVEIDITKSSKELIKLSEQLRDYCIDEDNNIVGIYSNIKTFIVKDNIKAKNANLSILLNKNIHEDNFIHAEDNISENDTEEEKELKTQLFDAFPTQYAGQIALLFSTDDLSKYKNLVFLKLRNQDEYISLNNLIQLLKMENPKITERPEDYSKDYIPEWKLAFNHQELEETDDYRILLTTTQTKIRNEVTHRIRTSYSTKLEITYYN